MKTALRLLAVRLYTAFQVLFNTKKHWFIVTLSTDEMRLHLSGKLNEYHIITHRLHHYNAKSIIQDIAKNMDPDEMALDKAAFYGEVEYNQLMKKQKTL